MGCFCPAGLITAPARPTRPRASPQLTDGATLQPLVTESRPHSSASLRSCATNRWVPQAGQSIVARLQRASGGWARIARLFSLSALKSHNKLGLGCSQWPHRGSRGFPFPANQLVTARTLRGQSIKPTSRHPLVGWLWRPSNCSPVHARRRSSPPVNCALGIQLGCNVSLKVVSESFTTSPEVRL